MRRLLCFTLLYIGLALPAQATIYFIDPLGSNSNNGLSSAAPFLSFAYAINPSRATCGDTLVLADGEYGDGAATATGKINIVNLRCTLGNELRIEAQNRRQARVMDSGIGVAISIRSSSYITLDGMYGRSTTLLTSAGGTDRGRPFEVTRNCDTCTGSDHITITNSIAVNANRYKNAHMFPVLYSTDIILEDNEAYIFGRHCATGFQVERMRVTRLYCNARGGKLEGGFNAGNTDWNVGDAVFSMYPCRDCILENSIGDGTETEMFLNEQNAKYTGPSTGPILQINAKVLASICYRCGTGNGVFPGARDVADANHSPQDFLVEDIAMIEYRGRSALFKCNDCAAGSVNGLGGVVNRFFGSAITPSTPGNTSQQGIQFSDGAYGVAANLSKGRITNSLITGVLGTAFLRSAATTLVTGDELIAPAGTNGTNFNPSGGGVFTNQSTVAAGYGTCKGVWVPDGAPGKGAGTGGGDIGANILYRTVNGVLTTTPLWDPITGEFPFGAADRDGINRVAGKSLFDIHQRLNINYNGCAFPAGYGGGGGGDPSTIVIGNTAASGSGTNSLGWPFTVAANQDRALVCIALRDDAGNVGSVTSVDASGQSFSLVKRAVTSPGHRAVELWQRASPTAGARTISVATTGAVTGMVGRIMEFDAVSGLNTAVSAASPASAPNTAASVTAPTNASELVVDCVGSSTSFTITPGADQTAQATVSHATKTIILGMSTQDGSAGGVMSWSFGGNVYWPQVAVSLLASPEDPPSTATLEVDKFRIRQLYGTEADAAALAAVNTQAHVTSTGGARVRVEIKGNTATTAPFGVQLFCRKDAEIFTRVLDTFEGKVFRLFGPDISTTIPASLTTTSNQLCSSNCVTGAFIRDQATSFVVPALDAGYKIELEWALQFNASPGDTVTCIPKRDDGSDLDTYTVTPTIVVDENNAASGF